MTRAPSTLRMVTFADGPEELWGAGWFGAPGEDGVLVLGRGEAATVQAAQLDGDQAGHDWRLHGDGVEIALTARGDAVDVAEHDLLLGGFDQLCQLEGRDQSDGGGQELRCAGGRSVRRLREPFDRFDCIREVCAWFEPGDGLALVSLRPRKARGHEQDLVSASLLDHDRAEPVVDPRLSTTYADSGRARRVGLELWLGEEADQYPRRAAGEAVGRGVRHVNGGWELEALPLRCYSRGQEGTGMYVLARRT